MPNTTSHPYWEDVFAGTTLLVYGMAGLAFYIVIIIALFKLAQDIAGFRILLSDAVANTGQLFIFAIWPGIIIILQRTLLPKALVAVLNDGLWFCMSEHYILIAFSRYVAVCHAFWFQAKFKPLAYPLCIAAWVVAFAQSISFRFMPWKTLFYYSPQAYGFINDEIMTRYSTGGEELFWDLYNMPVVFGPFLLYMPAAYAMWKTRSSVQASGSSRNQNRQQRTEHKLLIPCFVNQTAYFLGSVVLFKMLLSIGTKWGSWAVNIYFTTNSLINPIMLTCFSKPLRQKMLDMFGIKPEVSQARTATSRASIASIRRGSQVSAKTAEQPMPQLPHTPQQSPRQSRATSPANGQA